MHNIHVQKTDLDRGIPDTGDDIRVGFMYEVNHGSHGRDGLMVSLETLK